MIKKITHRNFLKVYKRVADFLEEHYMVVRVPRSATTNLTGALLVWLFLKLFRYIGVTNYVYVYTGKTAVRCKPCGFTIVLNPYKLVRILQDVYCLPSNAEIRWTLQCHCTCLPGYGVVIAYLNITEVHTVAVAIGVVVIRVAVICTRWNRGRRGRCCGSWDWQKYRWRPRWTTRLTRLANGCTITA